MSLPFDVPPPRDSNVRTRKLTLRIVTPTLGGGVTTRHVDKVDFIRVPTLRGHLRFWWRATAADAGSAEELYARESEIWGGTGGHTGSDSPPAVTKSTVRVSVRVPDQPALKDIDGEDVGWTAPGAYALWPARKQRDGTLPAERRRPGLEFQLTLKYPARLDEEIQRTLAAWICFGGYGSRPRRGLGKIAPACDESRKLVPVAAPKTEDELRRLFGPDAFVPAENLTDWPRLRGAQIAVGSPTANAANAWTTALGWLNEFRQQGPSSGKLGDHDPNFARRRGAGNRPSISNWPEADKVRQLSSTPKSGWSHPPQHNAAPVWPRAAFGLPILAQFQTQGRNGDRLVEPSNFELNWEGPDGRQDRLASPLIVVGMPLADDKFVPIALWLGRGYPEAGQVIAIQNGYALRGSAAAFDELVAPGDSAKFNPLAIGQAAPSGHRLRTAFFEWLNTKHSSVRMLGKSE